MNKRLNSIIETALLLFLFSFQCSLYGQLNLQWQKTIGSVNDSYTAIGVATFPTGGLVTAVQVIDNAGGALGNAHGEVLRLDATGNILWKKDIGGPGYDVPYNLMVDASGNIIVVGATYNSFPNSLVSDDIWAVKLDSLGNVLWQKVYGGSEYEDARSVSPTMDGGYLIVGQMKSVNPALPLNNGSLWALKLDSDGNLIWDKAFFGQGISAFGNVGLQTSDGGYLLGGSVSGVGGDIPGNYGDYDYTLVKLDDQLNTEWSAHYGSQGPDFLRSLTPTSDGGFLLCGSFSSLPSGDVTQHNGASDVWLAKINGTGNLIWQKSLGGSQVETIPKAIIQNNGNIIVSCGSNSDDFDVSNNYGNRDFWVAQLDSVGNVLHEMSFGGSSEDQALGIATSPNGVFIVGQTKSVDGDVTGYSGSSQKDAWIIEVGIGGDQSGSNNIDLSLSLSPNPPNPDIYTNTDVSLTITNSGSGTATDVEVAFPKPNNVVYTGGNEWTATQSTFNPFGNEIWTVGSLPPGATATLTVSYFILNENSILAYAQVTKATGNDPDSTPGNGSPGSLNEDDEAAFYLNAPVAPCQINTVLLDTYCYDNGTPNDSLDDYYSFKVLVTGTQVSNGWTANVDGIGTNLTGGYNIQSLIGTLNIFENPTTTFEVFDNANPGTCSTSISVTAPPNCSYKNPDPNCVGNVFEDGGFESGLTDNWENSNVVTSIVNSGISGNALQLCSDVQTNYSTGFIYYIFRLPSYSNQVELSWNWKKLSDNAQPFIWVRFYDSGNIISTTTFETSLQNTDEWVNFNETVPTPSNTTDVIVFFGVKGGGPQNDLCVLFDDVCIVLDKPATPPICSGDVILESQAEVDAFQGCEIIEGDLIIRSPFGVNGASSDITDLSPLQSLKEVTGTFQLENNDQLLNLNGLENITRLGSLVINYCENLNSLDALAGLTGEIEGAIVFWDNQAIPNFDALAGITGTTKLSLIRNAALQNLDGLTNLTYVNTDLEINENISLSNIQGLSNLASIGRSLQIANNSVLQDLNGLNNITSLESLVLAANDKLKDISGLNNLSYIDDFLYVAVNPSLSDCCIFNNLLNSSDIGGSITIEDNAPGCNSEQDIESSCGPLICTGDITLSSQAEVDAWPGCTVVEGTLFIKGNDITDLSPLASLQKVTELFRIENNPLLTDLTGLENVDSTGVLRIINNASLKNLNGLNGLNQTEIEYIIINSNHSLKEVDGFNNFVHAGTIFIEVCDSLEAITGLNNLISVDIDMLQIGGNPSLTDISGLSNLEYISGNLQIVGNDALTTINSLGNLTTVNKIFAIVGNDLLQDIDGFTSLSNIKDIRIQNNLSLKNLDALSNIHSISGFLEIENNPVLNDCCGIFPLLSSGGVAGNIIIGSNPMFCASEQDIINTCQPQGIDLELSMNSPTSATIYSSYPVSLTVHNLGDIPATGIKIHFPKPTGVVYTGGNEFTASVGSFNPFGSDEWNIGSLGAGETATLTVNYFLLQNDLPTAYAQVITANEPDTDSTPGNGTPPSVNEDDEASTAGTPPTPKPDLTILNLSIQNNGLQTGETLNFTVDISNLGNAPTANNFSIKYWLSIDNTISSDDTQGVLPFSSDLAAGITLTDIPGSATLPPGLPPGDYFLIVKVDADQEISESNEGNNTIFAPFAVVGQVCVGDIKLSSQAEVDAFNCQVVDGNLTIEGADIVDLSPMQKLVEITGILNIVRDSNLTNLTGLHKLKKAGGLIISSNPVLSSISRLKSLTGGELLPLIIENCPALVSLHGLHGITGCNYFRCSNNDALLNMTGLENLAICRGEFQIIGNASLENVNGLNSLQEINSGPLTIVENDALTDLSGFSNLKVLKSRLFMYNNNALTSLNGFQNLQVLYGLDLTNNALIENVDVFSKITTLDNLWVRDNANLSNCCGLAPVLTANGVGGTLEIYGNPLGCQNEQAVIDSCNSLGVDLELIMEAANVSPSIYTNTVVSLTLSNTGGETATGIKVHFPKPDGTVYTGGNEWTATQGTFNLFTNEEWTVGDLPAGGSVTLTVSYFLLTANALSPYAQVTAHNETDSDSSPGNGTPPTVNEDDEATILLNGFTGNGGGISLKNHNERFRLIFDNIFPNPAKYLITMDIFSRLDQTVLLDFYDVTGRSIHRMEVILEEGQNKVELDVSEWRSGTYNVIGRGDGLPAYGRFLKIWEE